MQLPFVKNKEPQKNFFLALLIKPHKIGAILFEEINNKLFILANHDVDVDDVEKITEEELLAAADRAISFVEGSLPEGSTVEKTIFSVPYAWITSGKIDAEHLGRLKKICQDLGLIPMGYLTTIEAIVAFLQSKEGAPISAIFIEVAKKKVFVYLVRAGRILEYHSSEVEENILSTVNVLFKKIHSVDVLPSKIVLLDYEDVDAQQEFLSHVWSKEIPFLHLPQVMKLENGFENEATINGVATQMELEVLQDIHAESEVSEKEESLQRASAQDFGFLKEKDVADAKVAPLIDKEPARAENLESHDLNVSNVLPDAQPSVKYFKKEDKPDYQDEEPVQTRESKLPVLAALVPLTAVVRRIKLPKLPVISGAFGGTAKPKILIGVAVAVVLLLAISFAYYNLILSVQVNVFADRKEIDKTANVTFSENPTSNESILIQKVEEEVKGDDTKNATGTKETGDRATGTVTIYNKTEAPKTFPKGTVVVGPNSLEFETQGDVSVASTSAFATNLSSANVKVTAAKYGKEYNIPSGSNFTVKGNSSSNFIAKNPDATSGGSSKTTTVVSQKDLDDLLAAVTKKLQGEALSRARSNADSESQVLPQALEASVVDDNYSKKVGDDGGSVGISATIKYGIGKYKKSDLQKVIGTLSAGEIPGTYILQESESRIDISDMNVGKNGDASAKLNVNAVYTPKIDAGRLAKEISGKSLGTATKEIKTITGVTDVNIKFLRQLPIFPHLLPFNPKNIFVAIKK